MNSENIPTGFAEMLEFGLVEALLGRRSRRFFMGAEIPDGDLCHAYLQAHHLDLEFYDTFYKPGAYMRTHAAHMDKWHNNE